jgi:predicted enzyme related to lactoylglutathione lyase
MTDNEQSTSAESASTVVSWIDLTVPNATDIRDFYVAVAGWYAQPLNMGDHDDYVMLTEEGGKPVGGICHAKGELSGYPPFWLPYFPVDNLDESIAKCAELGGAVIAGPMGGDPYGRFCVIRDVAGAFAALIEQPTR